VSRALLLLVLALCTWQAKAGDFSLLAGIAKVGSPDDGTYWNRNQQHTIKLTNPVVGVRYDTTPSPGGWGVAVQAVHYGAQSIDAMAVTMDAPHAGGYDPKTGGCVGACAPLARWVMQSETSALSVLATKHWGKWSAGIGLNVFEVKTSGYVEFESGSVWRYPSVRYLDVGPIVEVGYSIDKRLTLRGQAMAMEGRGATPSVSTGNTYSLLVSRSFGAAL